MSWRVATWQFGDPIGCGEEDIDGILTEDGDFLLTESGDFILLESA